MFLVFCHRQIICAALVSFFWVPFILNNDPTKDALIDIAFRESGLSLYFLGKEKTPFPGFLSAIASRYAAAKVEKDASRYIKKNELGDGYILHMNYDFDDDYGKGYINRKIHQKYEELVLKKKSLSQDLEHATDLARRNGLRSFSTVEEINQFRKENIDKAYAGKRGETMLVMSIEGSYTFTERSYPELAPYIYKYEDAFHRVRAKFHAAQYNIPCKPAHKGSWGYALTCPTNYLDPKVNISLECESSDKDILKKILAIAHTSHTNMSFSMYHEDSERSFVGRPHVRTGSYMSFMSKYHVENPLATLRKFAHGVYFLNGLKDTLDPADYDLRHDQRLCIFRDEIKFANIVDIWSSKPENAARVICKPCVKDPKVAQALEQFHVEVDTIMESIKYDYEKDLLASKQ